MPTRLGLPSAFTSRAWSRRHSSPPCRQHPSPATAPSRRRSPGVYAQTARAPRPAACSWNRAGTPRVLERSLAGRPSRPLSSPVRRSTPTGEISPSPWGLDHPLQLWFETQLRPGVSLVECRAETRPHPVDPMLGLCGILAPVGRATGWVPRAAPEHGRGPARHREDRTGIRSARCLSEASSRGPPVRPQRGRKRVGRAQQTAAGHAPGARLPSLVPWCPGALVPWVPWSSGLRS